MGSYLLGFLVVSGFTAVSVVGMLFVRKRVPLGTLRSYHEVAGYLLSVIGTLYAVLLGFVVVDAMNNLQVARETAEQEANAVANVFILAEALPETERKNIRSLCLQYVTVVIEKEWKSMAKGSFAPAAFQAMGGIWNAVSHYEPVTEGQKNVHAQILTELSEISDARRTRLVNSVHGVSPMLWAVLILGGIFTVVFTYFFGLESLKVQIVMTVLVAITLSLNVMLVYMFGYPFAGDVAVKPDAFQLDRRIFQHVLKIRTVPLSGGDEDHHIIDWENE